MAVSGVTAGLPIVPRLAVARVTDHLAIDGRLDEADWASVLPSGDLTQVDPHEGAPASAATRVRVLASPKAIVIGLDCAQPPDTPIVSYSVGRDALLASEDHVRIVLGPFLDGRSGYVFAINPNGARYDGLINPGGESDNPEWDVNPTGERLTAPFEVAEGVVIPPGSYEWRQYRLEAGTAQKRRLYSQVTWWFGGFYDGTLDQYEWTGAWNPTPLITVEFTGEHNVGRLSSGDFTQTLIGNRLRLNLSSDASISSYVQYDTDTKSVGVNTRLRWTFRPAGDVFVVYNHNLQSLQDRWRLESNQLLVKLQYAWRM
jgi:hypothetical protein